MIRQSIFDDNHMIHESTYRQGNLVKLSPGRYVKIAKANGDRPFLSLSGETQAILVELQGRDFKTNEDCWSVLVNNNLLLVWESHLCL